MLRTLRSVEQQSRNILNHARLTGPQVVLGNGEIVEANNKTNPDLFTALKGSQNNLAIITRLDIVAFK